MNILKNYNLISKILNVVCLAIFILTTSLYLLKADYFFDFTDESFYLLWSEQPGNFYGTTTHFGYLSNYIYRDLSYSIRATRIFIIITTASTLLFFCYNLYFFLKKNFSKLNFLTNTFLFSVGLSGLYIFNFFFVVLSYNWINYIGILLVTIGLLREGSVFIKNKIFLIQNIKNVIIISSGLFFIFFSKLSTYFLMNIFLFSWFYIYTKNSLNRLLLIQIFSIFLIVLFIYFCFGSLQNFVNITSYGLKHESILAENRSISGLLKSPFESLYIGLIFFIKNYYFISLGTCFFTFYLFFIRLFDKKITDSSILFVLLCFSILGIPNWFYNFYLLFLIIITTLIIKKNIIFSKIYFKKNIVIIFFGFCLPFAFSFGTANNIIYHSFFVSIFYLVAFFLIAISYYKNLKFILFFFIVFVFISFFYNLQKSFFLPYGEKSTLTFSSEVQILNRDQKIKVSEETATYIKEITKVLLANNWKKDNYILDLTGISPGTIYVLQGKVLYFSWFNAYFKGASNFLASILKEGNRKLIKSSWLITSDNKNYNLSIDKLFNEIGINLNENYTKILTINYPLELNTNFTFWKPKN